MRRGFTIIELIVVVVVILVLFVVAGIIIPSQGKRHGGHHQLKDATQLRGIGQAMFIWAMNNDDKYPLPSVIDVNNATVAELGRAKDTTGNIFALLVDDGSITPELCISPLDNNERITAYEDYETEEPTAAIDPVKALWDPGFSADFTAEGGGNISYAHLIPVGERLDMWKITNKGDEAILSNRGPEMASINRADGNVVTGFTNPDTNTILFAGSKKTWSGNIAFNDNHVELASDLYTHNKATGTTSSHRPLPITNDDGTTTDYHDVLFADEEGFESNQFLGIFTTAGESKDDYTAIWD